MCEHAGIGRQARLRGVCLWRVGSSPTARTNILPDSVMVSTSDSDSLCLGSNPSQAATKAEPKRYNVDLVSNDEGLRDFRKPFFVLDSQRYMLLFCRI